MLNIRVTGLKEVQNFLNRLPNSIRTEVGQKGIFELAQELKRRIELSYRMLGYSGGISTGFGIKSMQVRPTERGAIIEVLSPYLVLFEQGVRDHYVSMEIIMQHMRSPGSTFGLTAKDMGLAPPYMGPPVFWHWKGPFIAPAVELFRPEIPIILKRYLDNVIKGGK